MAGSLERINREIKWESLRHIPDYFKFNKIWPFPIKQKYHPRVRIRGKIRNPNRILALSALRGPPCVTTINGINRLTCFLLNLKTRLTKCYYHCLSSSQAINNYIKPSLIKIALLITLWLSIHNNYVFAIDSMTTKIIEEIPQCNHEEIDSFKDYNALLKDSAYLQELFKEKTQDGRYYYFNLYWTDSKDLNWYGSGDVDGDSLINQNDLDSLLKIPSNTIPNPLTLKYDRADVTGDGKINSDDFNLLGKYLNGEINYLPSHWKYLQTKEERISWLEKMLAIDKVDTLHGVQGEFMCAEFAHMLFLNFCGYIEFSEDSSLIKKYRERSFTEKTNNLKDILRNRRFNIPVYETTGYTSAHGYNSCLVGDNPFNFDDFYFIEPQTDKKKEVGVMGLRKNELLELSWNTFIKRDTTRIRGPPLVCWQLEEGIPRKIWDLNTNWPECPAMMYTERPSVGIKPEFMPEVHKVASLGSNYPNPFNYSTNIEYSLEKPSQVMLNVYDLNGRKLETLVNQKQEAGKYNVNFDGKNLSSGIYFYELTAGGKKMVRKMVLMK